MKSMRVDIAELLAFLYNILLYIVVLGAALKYVVLLPPPNTHSIAIHALYTTAYCNNDDWWKF